MKNRARGSVFARGDKLYLKIKSASGRWTQRSTGLRRSKEAEAVALLQQLTGAAYCKPRPSERPPRSSDEMLRAGARFVGQVTYEPNTGCHLWMGTLNKADGYGRFTVQHRQVTAHRFAYEMRVGPVPDGMELDHRCRQRSCVNPAHLEPVTHLENIQRGEAARRGRHCTKLGATLPVERPTSAEVGSGR